jgi:hypothetical protein
VFSCSLLAWVLPFLNICSNMAVPFCCLLLDLRLHKPCCFAHLLDELTQGLQYLLALL